MTKVILIAAALAAAPLAALAQSPGAALEQLNEQLAESPGDPELLASRGRLNFLLGNYSEAAADLWNATQADPALRANASLQIMRGRAVMQSGKPGDAVKVFNGIDGRDSEEAKAAFYAADAYSALGEDGQARAALERALELDPDYAAARVRLNVLGGAGEPEAPSAADAAGNEDQPGDAVSMNNADREPSSTEEAMPLDLQGPSADAQKGDEALLGLRGDADAEMQAETDDPVSLSGIEAPAAGQESGGLLADTEDSGDFPRETGAAFEGVDADAVLAGLEDEDGGEDTDEGTDEETAARPGSGGGAGADAEAAGARPASEPGDLREAASDAPVEALRQDIAAARAEGDTSEELDRLRDLYVREAATGEEIARFAELTGLTASGDPVRDFRLARLAEMARHTKLAAALYRGVVQSGAFEGRNLAITYGNLATQLRVLGNYEQAVEAADAAIEADAEYGNAWAVKGLAMEDQGMTGEALPILKEAYERGARAPELVKRLRQAGMEVDSQPSSSPQ